MSDLMPEWMVRGPKLVAERDAAVAALGDAKAEAERLADEVAVLEERNAAFVRRVDLEERLKNAAQAEVVAAKAEATAAREEAAAYQKVYFEDERRWQDERAGRIKAEAEAAALRDALQGLYDATENDGYDNVAERVAAGRALAAGGPLKERPSGEESTTTDRFVGLCLSRFAHVSFFRARDDMVEGTYVHCNQCGDRARLVKLPAIVLRESSDDT